MMVKPVPDLIDIAASICTAEHLRLIDEVGGGGFKKVFRVESGGETFALKVLKEETPRTARECQAMLRCDHPNIARLLRYDTHEFNGHCYEFLLEEYLGGGSLLDRLESGVPLRLDEIFTLGRDLIDALAHLNALQLVHRDIKPHNIMYRDDRRTPVLSDFGLVRDLSASSLTQTALMHGPGTPLFASPEQLNNQKDVINWRSDQFSLGVTLCVSALGVHPYQYPHERIENPTIIDRVISRQPRAPELVDYIQNEGFPCLIKMTNAWPVERYTLPSELAVAWAAQEYLK
jgi:serine/threonine protein kinase